MFPIFFEKKNISFRPKRVFKIKKENWEHFFRKNGRQKQNMTAKTMTNEQTEMIIGEMKCLVAEYRTESIFKLPLGLNLEDNTVVRDYWVKWDLLTISLMNGETLQITPFCIDDDKKHPDETRLEDPEDRGFGYDEDDVVEYDCYNKKEEATEVVEEPCIDCGEKPKYDDGVCEDCYEKITAISDTESSSSDESETPSEKSNQEEHNANNEEYSEFPDRRVEGQCYYFEENCYTYDKQNDWWNKHPNERLKDATKALAIRNAEDLAFASGKLKRPNDDKEDNCCMSCGVQEDYRNFCDDCKEERETAYIRDDGLTDEDYKDQLKDVMMPLRNTISYIEDRIDDLMSYEEGERDVEDLNFWKDIAEQIADRKLVSRK